MTLVYGTLAVVGGTVMLCQFVLTVFGLSHGDHFDGGHDVAGHEVDVPDGAGHDSGGHDAHHHGRGTAAHDATWFFSIITFRTVIAAVTFFGLAGLAANSALFSQGQTLVIALAAGAAAMFLVHQMMQVLHKLRSDGTARIERSVGRSGTVYLRVPEGRNGVGKVTVNLRDRTVEYLAVTADGPLPTGAKIIVTRVVSADTVEVEPATVEAKETSHV
jgi:membrane protein implicated in regulation of membrane protease activity